MTGGPASPVHHKDGSVHAEPDVQVRRPLRVDEVARRRVDLLAPSGHHNHARFRRPDGLVPKQNVAGSNPVSRSNTSVLILRRHPDWVSSQASGVPWARCNARQSLIAAMTASGRVRVDMASSMNHHERLHPSGAVGCCCLLPARWASGPVLGVGRPAGNAPPAARRSNLPGRAGARRPRASPIRSAARRRSRCPCCHRPVRGWRRAHRSSPTSRPPSR
jgi:hypothetical protein